MINELSSIAGVKAPAAVCLDNQLNASIGFCDRDGNSVLVVGQPLLAVLSRDELRAVLAHELAHVATQEGRLAASCQQLHRQCLSVSDHHHSVGHATGGLAGELLRFITRSYARRLFTLAFPVYRKSEFAADAFAARLCGARPLGRALMRIAIARWRAQTGDGHDLSDGEVLAQCLDDESGVRDIHPSLFQRLRALGIAPRL